MTRVTRRSGPSSRRAVEASARWTPLSLGSTLRFWYSGRYGLIVDGSDPTKTTQRTDRSGNGFNCTATGTAMPTTGSTYDSYDGSTDWMTMGTANVITAGFTIAHAIDWLSNPGASSGMTPYSLVHSSVRAFDEYIRLNLGGYQPTTFSANINTAATAVGIAEALVTGPERFIWTRIAASDKTDPASYTARRNGVAKTITTSGLVGRVATNPGSVGGIFQSGVLLNPAHCRIYDIIACDTVLSAENLDRLDAWLAQEFA